MKFETTGQGDKRLPETKGPSVVAQELSVLLSISNPNQYPPEAPPLQVSFQALYASVDLFL
jgi:hypothetical protein